MRPTAREPPYRIFRRISVVPTQIGASGLMRRSPVTSPTVASPKIRWNCRNFWFESALSGVVYQAVWPPAREGLFLKARWNQRRRQDLPNLGQRGPEAGMQGDVPVGW